MGALTSVRIAYVRHRTGLLKKYERADTVGPTNLMLCRIDKPRHLMLSAGIKMNSAAIFKDAQLLQLVLLPDGKKISGHLSDSAVFNQSVNCDKVYQLY